MSRLYWAADGGRRTNGRRRDSMRPYSTVAAVFLRSTSPVRDERGGDVEGLYCKRPIQCLASSEILTPHPPHRPVSVYPPAFGAGGGHTRWVERGWGVNSSEDARHCSVLYIYIVSTWPKIYNYISPRRYLRYNILPVQLCCLFYSCMGKKRLCSCL